MSIKAAVYCRVSSDEQRENQTIETQQDALARWLALQNATYEVVDWYLDDGVSGTLPWEERREGSRLLSDARRKAFDVVLCYEVSRLGRDDFGRFIINLAFDLQKLGIAIISITENIDTRTEDGRLLLLFKAGLAGYERATFARRSLDGTNHWAREGVWLGGIVPYGYQKIGYKKTARIVPTEEKLPGLDLSEADVVRLMYRMLADQGLSCFKIADYLNAMGVPPAYAKDGREVLRDSHGPEGKRKKTTAGIWRPSRIRNLVTNTVYKGVHIYGKRSKKPRELIERPVPPVVEPDTWQRAQETLRKNQLFSRRNAKRRYLLRLQLCRVHIPRPRPQAEGLLPLWRAGGLPRAVHGQVHVQGRELRVPRRYSLGRHRRVHREPGRCAGGTGRREATGVRARWTDRSREGKCGGSPFGQDRRAGPRVGRLPQRHHRVGRPGAGDGEDTR